jgi:hypothetical protein
MTPERFWRCVPCEHVIRLAHYDDVRGGSYPLWRLAARAERGRFLEEHRKHLVELLVQTVAHVAASGPLTDPATVLWWEVSNAARRFVVEGTRLTPGRDPAVVTLDRPMRYRCRPGRLRLVGVDVAVPTEELARAMDQGLFPHVLPVRKLDALTEAAARVVRALDADALELIGPSAADPSLLQARLRPEALEALLASLRPLLAPWEHARLTAHLRRLHAGDELIVGLQQRFEVELAEPDAGSPGPACKPARRSPCGSP